VTAVNDTPTATDNTITINEDSSKTFSVTDFGFNDIDGNSLQSIKITQLPTAGTLQLNGNNVTLNQIITAADIPNLVFTPVANANGTGYANFKFTVNDGTADSITTNTITVNVTAVNDTPTATDNTITINEDSSKTFSVTDFGFNDIDGNNLQSIKITQLPTAGTLQLNGNNVTLNQIITAADIPNLVFTPVANANGTGYANFKFTVNDGTADSTTTNTITVNVTSAPEFSITSASATEGNSITFTVTRTGDAQANQNVTLATSIGSSDTASANDFTAKTETLTFAQGETEKTFTVETAEDSQLEDNETFTVNLSSATNGANISSINGTAKGTINDDDIALVPIINNNIFTLRGTGETVRLKVTLISNSSNVVNELGIFSTDDNEGTIRRDDGISIKPGQQGYREAALERAKNQGESVFSAIANLPDLFKTEIQTNNLIRILEFDSGTNLQFFLVTNGTIDGFRSGVISNSNVIFADFSTQKITQENQSYILSWKESSTAAEFNSLVVRIESTQDPLEIGTAQKEESQAEIIDLTGIRDQGILMVKANFSVFREALFDNEVYFYKVDNSEGKIGTLTATAANRANYLQAAINNIISNLGNGEIIKFSVDNQKKFTDSTTIATGSILVPMIIVNGTLSQLTDNITSNDPQVYFPYLGLNSDGADHIRLLGNNIFGFEDLPNGGDLDYNDIIIKMNFTQIV
jgi:3-phytase